MNMDSIEKIIDGFNIKNNGKPLRELFDSLPIKRDFVYDAILLKITVAQEYNMPLSEFDKLPVDEQELLFAFHIAKARMDAIVKFNWQNYESNKKTKRWSTLLDKLKKFIKGLGL